MHQEKQHRSLTADTDAPAGQILLEDLGTLRFEGADAAGFLQGYLTTDTAELGSNPRFTAMCNIKGRVVCTGYAWLDDETVTLVLHRSLCPALLEFLRPYLAFSRTAASEVPSRVIGVVWPEPLPGQLDSLPGGRLDDGRYLFALYEPTPAGTLAGLCELGQDRWDALLVERREVWLQTATSGRFLPQMLGLDERGAVSFTKGCYLGQEVVARAQHRGAVKRRLATLDWSGTAPAPGTAVLADGREVGVVVAAAGTAVAGQALTVLVRDRSGPYSSDRADTFFRLPA